jgi:polyhydroxybutyrate depolymerase
MRPKGVRHLCLRCAALVLFAACGRGAPEATHAAPATASALPSAGCRDGTLPAVDGDRRRITVGGEERSYLLDAPAAAADRPLPLLLSFHGFRGSAWRHRWWTGLGTLARREELIALSPEGHGGVHLLDTTGVGWDFQPGETRDLAFVRALLDQLEAERCVDRRRVFATGMSNGGFFANLLGCALADRLAGIAPVSGAMALGRCEPARPIPVLFIYGSGDRVVRPDLVQGARDWWVRANGCTTSAPVDGCTRHGGGLAEVIDCEGEQGHWWPGGTTERIWTFFRAHPRA